MNRKTNTTSTLHFVLDGAAKTMPQPVTGEALYAKAGDPAEIVTIGGMVIERNGEVVTFDADTVELITLHRLSPTSRLNPEPAEPAD